MYIHTYISMHTHTQALKTMLSWHSAPKSPAAPRHGAAHPQRAKQRALPALRALKVLCLCKTQS